MLGHASAAMTMDLYGHLVDGKLWQAPGSSGASELSGPADRSAGESKPDENAW